MAKVNRDTNTSSTEITPFDDRSRSLSETLDTVFVSKYTSEFEHISCLGKGGFGVVFRAKKKFVECEYAVKRIRLRNNSNAKERMMREVKALAKLKHRNIVKYHNAWLEYPPFGWQEAYDKKELKLLSDDSMSYTDTSDCTPSASKVGSSIAIKSDHSNADDSSSIVFACSNDDMSYTDTSPCTQSASNVGSSSRAIKSDHSDMDDSSSIVFEKNSQELTSLSTNINAISTNNRADTSAPIYLYIQMQLCEKESLKDWLLHRRNRDHYDTLNIFKQIVDAVEYIHLQGLIHRDLKPGNIFFSLDGQVKVGDFGLVTAVNGYEVESEVEGSDRKSYTKGVGTRLYMSPEQIKCKQYDNKVDIYSLGIIFFELLVRFETEAERIKSLEDLRNPLYIPDLSTVIVYVRYFIMSNDSASIMSDHYELLKSMLSTEPEKRPNASTVVFKLSEIIKLGVFSDKRHQM